MKLKTYLNNFHCIYSKTLIPSYKIFKCLHLLLKIVILFILILIIYINFQHFFSNLENRDNKSFDYINFKNYFGEQVQKEETLIDNFLNRLPGFRSQVNCNLLFRNNNEAIKSALDWELVEDDSFWSSIEEASNKCNAIQEMLVLPKKPITIEEKNFPIAFTIVTNSSSLIQTLFLISSLYQPQNVYCLIVDASDEAFHSKIYHLAECFSNIFVLESPSNDFCTFHNVRSIFSCIRHLTSLKNDWKQFLYVPSVDLPLKTNLEMVRIFKEIQGTFNIDVEENSLPPSPIPEFRNLDLKSPIPVWKSNIVATFSREATNVIAKNEVVKQYYSYLENIQCPVQYLWATLAGNPKYIRMPGGFNAEKFNKRIKSDWPASYDFGKFANKGSSISDPFPLHNYYIASYQVWHQRRIMKKNNNEPKPRWKIPGSCKGEIDQIEERCIFGIGDLPELIIRPELLAHKFYMDVQPAAFFCLYERIKKRAYDLKNQQKYIATPYRKLPQVQILQGNNIDYINFFFDKN